MFGELPSATLIVFSHRPGVSSGNSKKVARHSLVSLKSGPEIHSIHDGLGNPVFFVDQVEFDPRNDGVALPKLEAVMHV